MDLPGDLLRGMGGTLKLLGAAFILGLVFFLGWGFYNVYLHPLRRYPGPRLWAAYRIPYVAANVGGRLPFELLKHHREYGPVVRIAPDELSFVDPEAWNDIYGLQKGRVQNVKDRAAYTIPQDGVESGIIHANDTRHARLRRIYGPAFTPKAVEEQSDMLIKYSNQLVDQLKAAIKTDPVQDMSAWYNFTTFDLTGEFAFDESFHCLDRGGQYHFFVKTIFDGVFLGLQAQQFNRYGIVNLILPFIPKSAMKAKDDMDRYTKELVDSRIAKGFVPGKTDAFNYLLENKNPDDQLTLPELYENGITLVVAGSETTATLLTGVTYFLCRNPDKLMKVQQEVRTAFKTDTAITPKTVNDLEYMVAVLNEGLRMFPPTAFGMPRIIVSKGGQSVAGRWVPENTRASVPHHAAYRYEQNFSRPEEFLPERWLSDPPAEFRYDKREVLQPFMVGPRGCLGKSLAYAEMRLLLAKMLWHFDMQLANPDKDWYGGLNAYMVWQRTALGIKLEPVKH